MELGQGYQIKTDEAVTLTVGGSYNAPEANPIALVQGWNMTVHGFKISYQYLTSILPVSHPAASPVLAGCWLQACGWLARWSTLLASCHST